MQRGLQPEDVCMIYLDPWAAVTLMAVGDRHYSCRSGERSCRDVHGVPPSMRPRPCTMVYEAEEAVMTTVYLDIEPEWPLISRAVALGASVRAVFGRLRRGHERRAALRSLMALDDRVLRDIGIGRGEIEGALSARLGGGLP
jgi:uncharacterized protein YjiS (DUF1127 family)